MSPFSFSPFSFPGFGTIVSTAARLDASGHTGIGYADSAAGLVPLPANTIELKYTLYGDTGLTGSVTFTDFMRMTQHYTLTGQSWSKGDFNYDGTVDSNDFNLLQQNFGQTLSAPVPAPTSEPATNPAPSTSFGSAPRTFTPPADAATPRSKKHRSLSRDRQIKKRQQLPG